VNTIKQTEEFEAWLDGLTDPKAQKAIAREIVKFEGGLFGDVKAIGKISEARIHYGPGYRIYFTRISNTVYLLLAGGTKRTQKKDIAKATDLAVGL
jgi:putative addiction module killer protein